MAIPFLQKLLVGGYVLRQHLSGARRYPLALMLEPLYRCNLACAGCGKIDYPDEILDLRLSLHDCVEQFYRSFYFRPSKIWEIVSEMAKSWGMTRRRLREGVEFFHFLRAHGASHSG